MHARVSILVTKLKPTAQSSTSTTKPLNHLSELFKLACFWFIMQKMRIPKAVLNRSKIMDTEEPLRAHPASSEEFYEQGVINEDSGDRWFSSDISKALRFYYRAYESYRNCLKLDPTNPDALYNLPRLRFDVYNKYIKDDSIILTNLENCADALNDNGEDGFLGDITSICKSFDSSEMLLIESGQQSSIGWDLYYNIALAYFELIEKLILEMSLPDQLNYECEAVSAILRCKTAFATVLDKLLTAEKKEIEQDNNIESVCEVVIEGYRMISSVYEVLFNEQLLSFMDSILADLTLKLDNIATFLSNQDLSHNLIVNLKISKLKERSARALGYDEFLEIWNSEYSLQSENEKLLNEASSTRSFIEKFDSADLTIDFTLKWRLLTDLSNKYRILTDYLRNIIYEIEKSNIGENDVLSKHISLLCSIYIERADIDLERSLMDHPDSIRNHTILQNNCKNFLKNALIYSKKSGGLKESASGKSSRKKKQREAAMRLCLIEGKSQEEWNTIIGEEYWPLELKEISSIEAYKQLFKPVE